jgi:predicted DNA-binding protein (UPF0251 family)
MARLNRSRENPIARATREGLRLVLVEGLSQVAAAAQSGAPRQSITRMLGSARQAVADAQVIAGAAMPEKRRD